ncbi:MAG: hypothetical protein GVY16_09620 [Planctomycetes bacterium]|nr:hypothetical protein [Planctomycetota bacterium]
MNIAIASGQGGTGKTTVATNLAWVAYCRNEAIDILAEIPDNRDIAEAYSRGESAALASPTVRRAFEQLFEALGEEAAA